MDKPSLSANSRACRVNTQMHQCQRCDECKESCALRARRCPRHSTRPGAQEPVRETNESSQIRTTRRFRSQTRRDALAVFVTTHVHHTGPAPREGFSLDTGISCDTAERCMRAKQKKKKRSFVCAMFLCFLEDGRDQVQNRKSQNARTVRQQGTQAQGQPIYERWLQRVFSGQRGPRQT